MFVLVCTHTVFTKRVHITLETGKVKRDLVAVLAHLFSPGPISISLLSKAQHTGVATRGREVSVHVLGAQ